MNVSFITKNEHTARISKLTGITPISSGVVRLPKTVPEPLTQEILSCLTQTQVWNEFKNMAKDPGQLSREDLSRVRYWATGCAQSDAQRDWNRDIIPPSPTALAAEFTKRYILPNPTLNGEGESFRPEYLLAAGHWFGELYLEVYERWWADCQLKSSARSVTEYKRK